MDYIIFRKQSKDFMRWSDGEVFVTNDEEEIKKELEREVEDNTNPVIYTLNYSSYFDGEGQEHQRVDVNNEKGEEVGCFSYISHFDDFDDFLDALDDWVEDYKERA